MADFSSRPFLSSSIRLQPQHRLGLVLVDQRAQVGEFRSESIGQLRDDAQVITDGEGDEAIVRTHAGTLR